MFAANLQSIHASFESLLGPSWHSRLTLVAVSKTVGPEAVREAWNAGQRDFGENRVQELLRKQEALADLPIRWHFIGHLQTNKVRQVVGRVELIHSVDSLRLAEALQQECLKRDTGCRILLEVKTTGEESKTGAGLAEARELAVAVRSMDRLTLSGLMTMGPLEGGAEGARCSFRALRVLHEELLANTAYRGSVLSMGMSGDYEVALEEGSTLVRIGTALFGSGTLA
ncbi:MAG: YggS family pyridoxal phosphate-dependent enzyme [Candidatus Riflebacteria bacterium]|nr:YggS family pyridoxal phosphate-dependent enzyme [Candidatus Riflebacteria bacterium]